MNRMLVRRTLSLALSAVGRSESRRGDQLASGLPVRVAPGERLRIVVVGARAQ
jgi:hypothetical protein